MRMKLTNNSCEFRYASYAMHILTQILQQGIRWLDLNQCYSRHKGFQLVAMTLGIDLTSTTFRGRTSQEPQSVVRHTHQHQSEKEYQDDVDDGSLLRLHRNLQREYPDKTVFTAVICPEVQEGQPLKMVAARVLLDTGSDVNIVSEKYLQEVGLSQFVTQIPEDEQFEMSGIEEQGPALKFERKFTSRFFMYSSRGTETAEFFVTKSSDWDILISQKTVRQTCSG
jgi:hypothetical protein